MPKLLGITQSGYDPASRFRFIQFIPYLEKNGWQVEHRPNRPDRQWSSPLRSRLARALHYRAGRVLMKANRIVDLISSASYDVAFVNRDFAAEGALFQKMFLPLMRKAIFDFDDALFVGGREKLVRWMCANAFWVTPGNEYLADYARQFTNRVTIIPTVIDTECCRSRDYSMPAGRKGPVRIGWSGSDQSIGTTLVPHLPMLEALQRQTDFELVVITNTEPKLPTSSLRWKFVPWKAEDEASLHTKFDIGIMPLVDDAFQKGKCALKLLQYMAAGLPTVASPVGVNQNVLLHQITGFAARTDNEWHEGLTCLLKNPELRAAMGQAGRERCQQHYSVRRWLPVLLNLFEKIRVERALSGSIQRPVHTS
ncbi:MAG: hypothetical protein JWM68_3659 [Verrucomicrobiales bacterium]|nr:hypothetical protein [Verrucomicrobiales bacterium]